MKKSAQLQIRVTEKQKEILRSAATRKNMGISEYVLSKLFNEQEALFLSIVEKVLNSKNHAFALAELNDFLTQLPLDGFESAVEEKPEFDLTKHMFRSNYITAMVEFAAARKGASCPAWTEDIPPLETPFFGSNLKSLRMHLLLNAPAAFKRRNIFIDSSIGGRVQMSAFSAERILHLFGLLNAELEKVDLQGELFLVGGAVMCLVFDARAATQDVDALFLPSQEVRLAAKRVAIAEGVDPNWLNDGVKGFLSENASFSLFLELNALKIYHANAEYLLAMKALAMRIGEEFHDISDVRYLIRYLNIETLEVALEIIYQYYPQERFPQKTLYALEEILEESFSG